MDWGSMNSEHYVASGAAAAGMEEPCTAPAGDVQTQDIDGRKKQQDDLGQTAAASQIAGSGILLLDNAQNYRYVEKDRGVRRN